jgi:hypothetical protein
LSIKPSSLTLTDSTHAIMALTELLGFTVELVTAGGAVEVSAHPNPGMYAHLAGQAFVVRREGESDETIHGAVAALADAIAKQIE